MKWILYTVCPPCKKRSPRRIKTTLLRIRFIRKDLSSFCVGIIGYQSTYTLLPSRNRGRRRPWRCWRCYCWHCHCCSHCKSWSRWQRSAFQDIPYMLFSTLLPPFVRLSLILRASSLLDLRQPFNSFISKDILSIYGANLESSTGSMSAQ